MTFGEFIQRPDVRGRFKLTDEDNEALSYHSQRVAPTFTTVVSSTATASLVENAEFREPLQGALKFVVTK